MPRLPGFSPVWPDPGLPIVDHSDYECVVPDSNHLTREMYSLMGGRHVHPSTLYPGGVGTIASHQLFSDYLTRLMKYVDFIKRGVPLHDATLLADFHLPDSEWERLLIPISLGFLYRSSIVNAMIACYPSPLGIAEELARHGGERVRATPLHLTTCFKRFSIRARPFTSCVILREAELRAR